MFLCEICKNFYYTFFTEVLRATAWSFPSTLPYLLLTYVWVCMFTSIHREGFICLEELECQGTINDVMLKTSLSTAKSFHCYFRMKYRAFLTSHFICSHIRSGQSHNLTSVCLAFKTYLYVWASFNITGHRPCSALHRKAIYLWRQAFTSGVAI